MEQLDADGFFAHRLVLRPRKCSNKLVLQCLRESAYRATTHRHSHTTSFEWTLREHTSAAEMRLSGLNTSSFLIRSIAPAGAFGNIFSKDLMLTDQSSEHHNTTMQTFIMKIGA